MRRAIGTVLVGAMWVHLASACNAAECGPNASCITPQLHIDACAEPPREVQGKFIGGVSDCSLDFGTVVGPTQLSVLLSNPGIIDVSIAVVASPPTEDDPVAFILLGQVPPMIGPGLSEDVLIETYVRGIGASTGLLLVTSDAANFPAGSNGTVEVELLANAPP